jgi:hypothetical protein
MTASVSESVGGEILGHEGSSGYSDYNASGGKKKSRRRSKKNMGKMYGGTEEFVPSGTTGGMGEEQEQTPGVIPGGLSGGRRRRRTGKMRKGKMYKGKMYKGKMYKGKTRKGKVSSWIIHVKNFSRANKMDFRDALRDPKCKATYHKMK